MDDAHMNSFSRFSKILAEAAAAMVRRFDAQDGMSQMLSSWFVSSDLVDPSRNWHRKAGIVFVTRVE